MYLGKDDALEFLYNHNTTHLLIDPTDIGKYGAFSSIGSDKDFDRFSWIPIMILDRKQMQETANGTVRVYQGGTALDEDIILTEGDSVVYGETLGDKGPQASWVRSAK